MNTLPKIALVGRPNVGKSALFNRISQKRISIVDEQEGITRDRLYTQVEVFGKSFILVDTGGIDPSDDVPFNKEIRRQAKIAIEEANVIILVVDGQIGPHPLDEEVAKILLQSNKPLIVAVNKIDQDSQEIKIHEFYSLAIKELIAVSATQGFQIAELLEKAISLLPEEALKEEPVDQRPGIRVAIVGRANVGKSTLLNHLLQEDRSIVSPIAGTTRDSIDAAISHEGQDYILVDTAGIRRKKAEKEVVDKFAAIRTEEAIAKADVCLLVMDSYEGFTTQEKRIAAEIEAQGKSCILIFNKWDLVKEIRMEHALRAVREDTPFLNHCPALFISAIRERNLDKILRLTKLVYEERLKRISTGSLNKFIEGCLHKYHPPLITGKRLRIYYMTQVESNPPKFVLFINKPTLMTESYKKYIMNNMREAFKFTGCPITLELRGKTPPPASEPRLL
jgi:GTP-binding protein